MIVSLYSLMRIIKKLRRGLGLGLLGIGDW